MAIINRREIILRVINAVFFYLGWLVCMHQAKGPHPYLGPLVIASILGCHLLTTSQKVLDGVLIVSLGALGTIVDTLYIQVGMITFKGGYSNFPGMAPLWISSLWALYAASINHSLAWLNRNILLAAVMGGGGAISSYLVGLQLGAADLHWPEIFSLAVIGSVWALVVPLSLKYNAWLKHFFL